MKTVHSQIQEVNLKGSRRKKKGALGTEEQRKGWQEIFHPQQAKLDNRKDTAFKSWKKIVNLEFFTPWEDLSNTEET